MIVRLALRVLGEVMARDDETARQEYRYLAWMAAAKYDAYQDYVAGGRFLEHLVRWLQQFEPQHRNTAWRFVRHRLVFISAGEMQRLVELFYPQVVEPILVSEVSERCQIAAWRVWADPNAIAEMKRLRRKCLFMGLSDGARLDRLRRANDGHISNEQVVLQTQLDKEKWEDLRKDLRSDLGDPTARFEVVFLIDDFIASGRSLLREADSWKGKLPRFAKVLENLRKDGSFDELFSNRWRLCVHHYLANTGVLDIAAQRWETWRETGKSQPLPRNIEFTKGVELPLELALSKSSTDPDDVAMWSLTTTYFNPAIVTKSFQVGGEDPPRGFAGCALPIVLEHNTPNNSIPLLWAETEASGGHAMRPLFYRRQRHG